MLLSLSFSHKMRRTVQATVQADVLRALLLFVALSFSFFAILSRLSTISFTTHSQAFWYNSAENWSIIWFGTLDVGLSPLMSMSSELTNSSIDERITASYALLVARVDKFLYEASCAWASYFFLECRERVVHLRHHFTSCRTSRESDMPRVVSFTCVLPRFVKLGPRDAARKRSAARWVT